jgi:hypothetical protein
VIGIKKKPDTGQKKTYNTTDNFFGVVSIFVFLFDLLRVLKKKYSFPSFCVAK